MTLFAPNATPPVPPLPVASVLPRLCEAMARRVNAVLLAPPGAGKTTLVPLALLEQPWLAKKRLVMLEPRRLAARAAARRMAAMLGEEVGGTVGYRMRLESRCGLETRIEVVTEGVLTRMIQDDPGLSGIGAVVFDEFHERSLAADLGLALCLEAQEGFREDLRILAMSATMDGDTVARLLGDAPVIAAEGRTFPVDTRWLEKTWSGRLEDGVARLVLRALSERPEGDVLVFLPGQAEIRRVLGCLGEPASDVSVLPLYGDLPPAEQDRAIRPIPGKRKVVLATDIAETSLTIEGVAAVVDSGLARHARFDPGTGMSRLVTLPLSKASAEQRRGRAGRLGPGTCYRLWTEAEHRALPAFATPEITEADLAPLALELARWGVSDPASLSWLDPPPRASFASARGLLAELGALDGAGHVTGHGQAMARLPLHPRLAHMVLKGRDLGLGALAAELAALLSERDPLMADKDADLRRRIELLRSGENSGVLSRARESARRIRRQLSLKPGNGDIAATGLLVAFAYPDRIAQRRGRNSLQYLLSNGQGACFREPEALCLEETLAIAALDGNRREARVFLGAPVTRSDIEEHFFPRIIAEERVAWDARAEQVVAERRRRLGHLTLSSLPIDRPDPGAQVQAMLTGIRTMGPSCLPWNDEAARLRARIAFLRGLDGPIWPDLSDEALFSRLEEWLPPWLDGVTRRAHLDRLDMARVIEGMIDGRQRRTLVEEAPTHLVVPSGNRVAIDYTSGVPVLAVKLQEMFGLAETPTVGRGRVRLVLHLLSPARRPVQVTQDLAGFWEKSYAEVRADLRGRYPKHPWPDDPMQAEPTARARRRKG